MRRPTLAVLTTVSLAALVSVSTTSEAVQSPSVILGVLKPTEDWKVGTVNVTGASFCAMVNKYDSGVGLAFARSPEGYGTVAMDLRQNVFTVDNTYDVTLKTDGQGPRKLQGRATSARSLVVQIGQDKALYDALNGNGTMEMSMEAADVSFSLAKFSNSFKSLVSCSDKLLPKAAQAEGGPKMAAVKVQDVEQASLAPIDKELQGLNGKTQIASNDGQNSLDAQLDAAASAQAKTSQANIAKLDQQQQDVTAQINQNQQQAAQLQDQKQQVERKLIASLHTQTPPVPPSNTGAVAKLWDEQQTAAAQARAQADAQQAKAQQALDQKNTEIAQLQDSKAKAAQAQVADAAAQQQALQKQADAVTKQRDVIAAKADADGGNKALKAELVAKEAQLASLSAKDAASRDQLAQKLSSTQSDFEKKIAALEGERDGLKTQLSTSMADAAKWQQADVADRAHAKDLEAKVASMDAQGKTLAAAQTDALSFKDQLAKAEAGRKDAEARLADLGAKDMSLAGTKTQDAQKLAQIQEQLTDKTAQFDALKGQYDTLQHDGTSKTADLMKDHRGLSDQLAQKQSVIDTLTEKLAQIQADRATEVTRAQQAQADLTSARQQVQGLHKGLVVINDDEMASGAKAEIAALRQQNADLTAKLADVAKPAAGGDAPSASEVAALKEKNAELSEQLALQAQGPDATAQISDLKNQNADLQSKLSAANTSPVKASDDKSSKELADLRAKNAELESRLASASAAPQKDPALDKAQAQLADLKEQNADLQSRVASASKKDPALDRAQAELADLKAKNAALSDKLASAQSAQQKAATDTRTASAAPTDAKTVHGPNGTLLAASVTTAISASPEDMPRPGAKAIDAQISVNQAQQRAEIDADKAEIQRLQATRTALEQQIAMQQKPGSIQPMTSAPALAQVQPEAGDTVATATNAATAAAPKKDPSFDENRAEAFLDRIMAYHTGSSPQHHAADAELADASSDADDGVSDDFTATPAKPMHAVIAAKPAIVVPVTPVAPAIMADAAPSKAETVKTDIVKTDVAVTAKADAPKSAAPVINWNTPEMADASPAKHGDDVMTALPGKDTAKDASVADASAVISEPVKDDITQVPLIAPKTDKVASSAPVVSSAPKITAEAAAAPVAKLWGDTAAPVSLDGLLNTAGVDAQFKPGSTGNIRQWASGKLNGMYEQMAPGDFTTQAHAYIERYQKDCPGKLDVNMGQPQTTAAGTFATANIACSMSSNTYNTSFVFVQNSSKFGAILTTGYPEDAAKVRSTGDSIAYALGSSGGLSGGAAVQKADATPVHAIKRPSLVISSDPVSDSAAHQGGAQDDGHGTVIVQ